MKTRSGFTLVEVLVVLVIVGLVASLTTPAFPRLYESYVRRQLVDQVSGSISSAAIRSYSTGESIELVPFLERQVELPSGWELRSEAPIIVDSTGVCFGGDLYLVSPQRVHAFHLTPPFCGPGS